jgi:protein TonB
LTAVFYAALAALSAWFLAIQAKDDSEIDPGPIAVTVQVELDSGSQTIQPALRERRSQTVQSAFVPLPADPTPGQVHSMAENTRSVPTDPLIPPLTEPPAAEQYPGAATNAAAAALQDASAPGTGTTLPGDTVQGKSSGTLTGTSASNNALPGHATEMGVLKDRITRYLKYPALARRRAWSGKTVLQLNVNENGQLADLGILTSSGYPVLDQAAQDALRRCFPLEPPVQNGSFSLTVVFDLSQP